ncbi:hypothetical protein [Marinitoga aeolica]|uniref:Uncharacterized protein n=1 Tax=Marinitoga aeolica TaxID=2809031 RepID=A0ABY8PTR4_9BACT|nr:hypothetical protein [Marinitoga aeolica]WGS66013.1 hypothetical protein JRV97_05545 [Marinitoga aeolica]
MVINFYFNNRFLYRFKRKGFNSKKINIVDYYGIIKKFSDKTERNKFIIKNSKNYNISTQKIKYIVLKDNTYYMYITSNIKKFRNSIFFDYTIPLNYMLWYFLEKNNYESEYISFIGESYNIIYQKIDNEYLYGVYSDEKMGEEIQLDNKLLINIINEIKGDFLNAVYV